MSFYDGMLHGFATVLVCFVVGYALYSIFFTEERH